MDEAEIDQPTSADSMLSQGGFFANLSASQAEKLYHAIIDIQG